MRLQLCIRRKVSLLRLCLRRDRLRLLHTLPTHTPRKKERRNTNPNRHIKHATYSLVICQHHPIDRRRRNHTPESSSACIQHSLYIHARRKFCKTFLQGCCEVRFGEAEEESTSEGLGEHHERHGDGVLFCFHVVLDGYDWLEVVSVMKQESGEMVSYDLETSASANSSKDHVAYPFPC